MIDRDNFVVFLSGVCTAIAVLITAHSPVPDTRPAFSTAACSDVQAAYVIAHDEALSAASVARVRALCK